MLFSTLDHKTILKPALLLS